MSNHLLASSRRFGLFCAALLAAIPASALPATAAWPPDTGKGSCTVTKETNVEARMRDGVILRADVYRPKTDHPVPVILMRTQYGKSVAQVKPSRFRSPAWFASHCYIVVIQDIRGQYASDGVFDEYTHDRNDGYDSVEWAARLPGSNGKVGMYGSSYVGATQWLAATATPPSLKAIIPSNTASDYYDGWTYEDGAFRLAFIEGWMLEDIVTSAAENRKDAKLAAQLKLDYKQIAAWMHFTPYDRLPPMHPGSSVVAPYFFEALQHSTKDNYWNALEIESRYNKVNVPVLAFDGWYDAFLDGSLCNFTGMRKNGATDFARTGQRIIIGPWEHLGWGRPDSPVSPRLKAIGPVANSPVNELSLLWFDHFLKGEDNGVSTGPRVDYFEMGENKWHAATAWPLPQTEYRKWYLDSDGHAASLMGDGTLTTAAPAGTAASSDSFVYDPANPVPSIGGHSCCSWTSGPQGQFDQSSVEQRSDILVYSTPELTTPLEITGPITVTLYASSSAPDTDFTAKLIDVFPDGSAINLNNGIQRASYRESLTHPTPIAPGKVYAYKIHVWPTSNLFKAGHKIRVEISSSDFPQFDPNPNTGKTFATTTEWKKAEQRIFHDQQHPSSITLPVIPAAASGEGRDVAPEK